MSKYLVKITEILQRQVEVEAKSIEEAEDAAIMLYRNEDIVLDAEDFVDAKFKAVKIPEKLRQEVR